MYALLLAVLISQDGAWTQIAASGQLQCHTAHALTVGYPAGRTELVARVEAGRVVKAEVKLPAFDMVSIRIMDVDESGCEEALVDLTDGELRTGLFVSFPGGNAKVVAFPTTPATAEPAKRLGARLIRVYYEKKGKPCMTDYRIEKDALVRVSDGCY